jgi:hypothetical protein
MVFGDLTYAYHVTDCYYILKADSQTLFHVISFLSANHHKKCLTTELHHSTNVATSRTDLVVGSFFWMIFFPCLNRVYSFLNLRACELVAQSPILNRT